VGSQPGPSHRGGVLPARGKPGDVAVTVAPRLMGLFGGEEGAGGWMRCSSGCSSQVEIKQAEGDALKHFAAFRRSPLE